MAVLNSSWRLYEFEIFFGSFRSLCRIRFVGLQYEQLDFRIPGKFFSIDPDFFCRWWRCVDFGYSPGNGESDLYGSVV